MIIKLQVAIYLNTWINYKSFYDGEAFIMVFTVELPIALMDNQHKTMQQAATEDTYQLIQEKQVLPAVEFTDYADYRYICNALTLRLIIADMIPEMKGVEYDISSLGIALVKVRVVTGVYKPSLFCLPSSFTSYKQN